MPVAFDATILLPLLSPTVSTPIDRATGKPIESVEERLNLLLKQLEENHTKIIIPTPALSEILVHADKAGPEYLNRLKQSSAFAIKPFDDLAAVEVALMTREAIKSGDKRGGVNDTWAKVKFDRQIVAIAKVNGASVIYSDDDGVQTFATQAGLTTVGISQLALPPPSGPTQIDMFPEVTSPKTESMSIAEATVVSSEEPPLPDPATGEATAAAKEDTKDDKP